MATGYKHGIYVIEQYITKNYNKDFRNFIMIIYYIMSTIPKQNLMIENDTDTEISNALFNGTYKTFSSTELSNNVYFEIWTCQVMCTLH